MSDDDSSSSDDLPLAALGKKSESSSDEAEFEEEDDDEEMDHGEEPDTDDFIEDDSDEDDDDDGDYDSDSSDDVPLSTLKSKKKEPPPKKAATKKSSAKKAAPKKKAATSAKKKKSTAAKKSSKTKQASSSSSSNYLCASSELYSQCDKGKLIQSLLARWWYSYQWPDPKSILASTPKGYDALDGFPGVYICTQGGEVGKFLDKRDKEKAPSFKNFAKKDSEELKDMLLRAIEAQLEELIKHEGEGTDTEKQLKVLEKWAMKLNCSKADKEAAKVLKAMKLKMS